jgi:hypothetical protein
MLEPMSFRAFLGARFMYGQILGMNLIGLTGWLAYIGWTASSVARQSELLVSCVLLAWAAYWWNYRLAMEVVVHPASLAITTMLTKPIVELTELSGIRRSRFRKVVIFERRVGGNLWIPYTHRVDELIDAICVRQPGIVVGM